MDRRSVALQLAVNLLLAAGLSVSAYSVHLLIRDVTALKDETFRQANEIEGLRAALRIIAQGDGP